MKTSKKGVLAAVIHEGEYITVRKDKLMHPLTNRLTTVFENGNVVKHEKWNDIQQRANKTDQ